MRREVHSHKDEKKGEYRYPDEGVYQAETYAITDEPTARRSRQKESDKHRRAQLERFHVT